MIDQPDLFRQSGFAANISAPLRVLIACECSGTVRDAFLSLGHDAWSCDIKPDERRSNRHIQGDVRDYLADGWDLLMVAHPPCTRLCNSGARWLTSPPPGRSLDDMWRELEEGADFFSEMWNADIPRVAVENPVMHRHAKERIRNFEPHTQSIQPWQFGTDPEGADNEKKRTCLWLRGLPPLVPTGTLDGTTARDSVHKTPGGRLQATRRSRFFPGIARAMAEQWGGFALEMAVAA
jgi:hypothetical protein